MEHSPVVILISFMEKFDDLVDGQGHVVRVLEGMVGPFDGDELDDVVLGERFGVLEGDHLVLRAVQDHHTVGEVGGCR